MKIANQVIFGLVSMLVNLHAVAPKNAEEAETLLNHVEKNFKAGGSRETTYNLLNGFGVNEGINSKASSALKRTADVEGNVFCIQKENNQSIVKVDQLSPAHVDSPVPTTDPNAAPYTALEESITKSYLPGATTAPGVGVASVTHKDLETGTENVTHYLVRSGEKLTGNEKDKDFYCGTSYTTSKNSKKS